jgi:hypothetical protein
MNKNNHKKQSSNLNKSKKKKSLTNHPKDKKTNIYEKIKENTNLYEYKLNSVGNSNQNNNNFTNIKTDKIVFIDLKNSQNTNILSKSLNNDNLKEENNYNLKISRERNIYSSDGYEKNNRNSKISKENNLNYPPNMKDTDKFSNSNQNNIFQEKQSISNGDTLTNNNQDNIDTKKEEYSQNNLPNINNYTKDNNLKEKINIKELQKKGLNYREVAFYLLSKTPILGLCGRFIFSRGTDNLKKLIKKEDVLEEHKKFLNDKILELNQNINLCDKVLNTPFYASKIAEITTNVITSFQEIEFKQYPVILMSEDEQKYYINYLKLLFYLLDEKFDEETKENNADNNNIITKYRENLYKIIEDKEYKDLKDYLIKKFINNKDNIRSVKNIEKINDLIKNSDNMFEINNSLKICKFISFSLYLIKEIVNFGNNLKLNEELKVKAQDLSKIMIIKSNNFKSHFNLKD